MTGRVFAATCLFLLFLCAGAQGEEGNPQPKGSADVAGNLRAVVRHLDSLETKALPGTYPPSANRDLKRDVDTLTTIVNTTAFPSAIRSIAQYTRARARSVQNDVLEASGAAIDPALALGALADLDAVIAAGIDVPTWRVTVTNAQYMAGIVVKSRLRDDAVAFAYWDLCAQKAHAGCLNIMATARLTGLGGQKIDIKAALDLHAKVVDTGTDYACAGAYSALEIAMIGHFTGVHRGESDGTDWTKKADELLDKLEAAHDGRDLCNRAEIETVEFLLRLSDGTRDEDVLRHAVTRAEEPATKAVAFYLSGLGTVKDVEAALDAVPSEYVRCEARFDVLWYAQLTGDKDMSAAQHEALKKIGFNDCAEQLVFARTFGFQDDGPR